MRIAVVALGTVALFALAACTGAPEAPPVPRLHATTVDDGKAIEVRVSELSSSTWVGEIRLVAPDGRAFPAEDRRTRRGAASTRSRPSVGVGATGGSSSGVDPAISLSLPLSNWSWARAGERNIRTVVARIPVPGDYRKSSEDWLVEVELIDGAGAERTRRMAAPS